VIDWPVATTAASVATMRSLMENGQCEIGAHLHPWVSPPHEEAVSAFNSYAGNLSKQLELKKLRLLTEAITDNFQRAPITFKAGRYGVGPHTAESIASLGYKIDASIVPYTSFTSDGGPDFSEFTEHPYWFTANGQQLLELPATAGFCGLLRNAGREIYALSQQPLGKALRLGGIAARSGISERIRLTPEGCTTDDMKRLTSTLVKSGCQVVSLTYHSPSLAPGHTPYVRSAAELEKFLDSIRDFCTYFRDELGGVFMSVSEVYEKMRAERAAAEL
jgi:hypothetical protein